MFDISFVTACILGAVGGAGILMLVSQFFTYLSSRKRASENYYIALIKNSEIKYSAQTLATSEEQARRNIIESEECDPDEIASVTRITNMRETNEFEDFMQA